MKTLTTYLQKWKASSPLLVSDSALCPLRVANVLAVSKLEHHMREDEQMGNDVMYLQTCKEACLTTRVRVFQA